MSSWRAMINSAQLSLSFSFPSIPLFLPSSLLFNASLCESKTILVDSLHLGLLKELEVVLSPAYHIFSTVELWFIGFSFLGMFFIPECFPFFNHCVTLINLLLWFALWSVLYNGCRRGDVVQYYGSGAFMLCTGFDNFVDSDSPVTLVGVPWEPTSTLVSSSERLIHDHRSLILLDSSESQLFRVQRCLNIEYYYKRISLLCNERSTIHFKTWTLFTSIHQLLQRMSIGCNQIHMHIQQKVNSDCFSWSCENLNKTLHFFSLFFRFDTTIAS